MMWIIMLIFILLLGILAPWITPHNPEKTNINEKLESPSNKYPLGTDHLGRCIYSRLVYGIRTTLGMAMVSMIITIFIGLIIGITSGYFRGPLDEIIMRLCDVMLSFPSEVMILAIVGILGPGLRNIIVANIAAKWPWYTRMIRTIVVQQVNKNYIGFAKVSGCNSFDIIKRHILPSTISEIILLASIDAGAVILSISGLSFLGLGVQAPTAEWGIMLNEAKNIMITHPAQMLPPGLAILLVVLAFNFIGDRVRDIMDLKYIDKGVKDHGFIRSKRFIGN